MFRTFTSIIATRAGVSLVQALVTMGIMSILALGMATLISTIFSAQAAVATNMDVQQKFLEFSQTLADSSACTTSLQGVNLSTTSAFVIRNPFGVSGNMFEQNEKLSKGATVKLIRWLSVAVDPIDNTHAYARMRIVVEKNNTELGGKEIQREFGLYVTRDSSNNIVNCNGDNVYIRGAAYGSCYIERNAGFHNTVGKFMAWPITSCPESGFAASPTCAEGFELAVATMAQGNSADASTTSIGSYAAQDVYWVTYNCVKK
ncbi:MAG: hypothetical protein AAGB31_01135 [Bdellovibrio sp.]